MMSVAELRSLLLSFFFPPLVALPPIFQFYYSPSDYFNLEDGF